MDYSKPVLRDLFQENQYWVNFASLISEKIVLSI